MWINRLGRFIVAILVVGLVLAISTVAQACCFCNHPDDVVLISPVWNSKFTSLDSEYHLRQYYAKGVCYKCDEQGGKGFVYCFSNQEETEAHRLDASGRCKDCNNPAYCQHKEKKTYGDPTRISYVDSKEHFVLGPIWITCDLCGTVIRSDGAYMGTRSHEFVNGKCACGYTQTSSSTTTPIPSVTSAPGVCSHPSGSTTNKELYRTYEPQSGDEQRHRVVVHSQVTCTKCGTVVKADEVNYQVALHDFGGGSTCSKCGYNKAGYYMSVDQGHINGLVAYAGGGQGATINVTSNVEWTAVPDETWIHVYNMTGNGNGSFSVSVDANNGYAREGHILLVGTHGETIDIKVSQDGAIVDPATCVHDFVPDYNNQVSGTGKWKKVDDTYHIRESLEFIEFCSKCGAQQQVRKTDTGAVNEKHTFGETSWTRWMSNETQHARNGKKTCTAPGCGYIEDVKETGEHEYEDTIRAEKHIYIDEAHHQLVTTYYKQCDCGATTSTEVFSDYLAAHVYNEDTGECLAVGCTSVLKDDPTEMCEHRWGASWVCSECNLRKENAEELLAMQKRLTEAITQPYYSDRLNAKGDYAAVSDFEMAVMELLAKGIVGTTEYEIEQGIRNADAGIDNGRDIVHKMVYDEVFKIEKNWNTFVKEMSSLSNGIRENFTTEKAQAIYLLSQIDDSEYVILLDGDQNSWAKNPKLKSLWMLLGDEALRDYSQMDEYRRSAKSLGAQSLNILSEAGKWASKIGKGINLMNTGANYLLEYFYKDELNATIDKWIAATDDDNLKAELEDYKCVYNSEVGIIISTFTDSGFASSELKDIGTLMAEKGLFGSGVKKVASKLGKSAFTKVISQADTVLTANQLIYKYLIGIDIDSMYSSFCNLLTVDELYRSQVEEVECFFSSGKLLDEYENELRLAAALSKLECQYYLAILDNNMLGLSEAEKERTNEFRAAYSNYITAIDEHLDEYLDALQNARDTSLYIH